MKENLHIIKIGGNVIDHDESLQEFLGQFSAIKEPKILVHGGGKIATSLAKQLGIPQKMVEGRRITDKATLKLITMVYGGLLNKNIVAQLVAQGNNAIGLSGADGNSITAIKRPVASIDYGFVGDIKSVNTTQLQKLLAAGFTPVFCALTHDTNGQLLNTNADTMAARIASAMGKVYTTYLYYCFEKKGVLTDIHNEDSVISDMSPERYQQLKQQKQIYAGMIPKLDTAFEALKSGVYQIRILHADYIKNTIISKENHGTRISS